MKKATILTMVGVLTLVLAGAAYSGGWGGRHMRGGYDAFERGYGPCYEDGRGFNRQRAWSDRAPGNGQAFDGYGRGRRAPLAPGQGPFCFGAVSEVETADEAKALVEKHLEFQGNPNLKAGKVTEKEGVYEVEIVTKDDSLVNLILIDRETGRISQAYR